MTSRQREKLQEEIQALTREELHAVLDRIESLQDQIQANAKIIEHLQDQMGKAKRGQQRPIELALTTDTGMIPDFPILFGDLPPEKRSEGLELLREMLKGTFPDLEQTFSDAEILASMKNFDLRFVMGDSEMEC